MAGQAPARRPLAGLEATPTTAPTTSFHPKPPAAPPYSGPLPEPDIWDVLLEAWARGIWTSGNFARAYAYTVGLAASLGWISTVTPDGRAYMPRWHITLEGIAAYHTRRETPPSHFLRNTSLGKP